MREEGNEVMGDECVCWGEREWEVVEGGEGWYVDLGRRGEGLEKVDEGFVVGDGRWWGYL